MGEAECPLARTLQGVLLASVFLIGRVPLDKSEGSVKDKLILGSAEAPFFSPERLRTIDKSEGSVKDKLILGSAEAPFFSPERLRTKALEISRGIT